MFNRQGYDAIPVFGEGSTAKGPAAVYSATAHTATARPTGQTTSSGISPFARLASVWVPTRFSLTTTGRRRRTRGTVGLNGPEFSELSNEQYKIAMDEDASDAVVAKRLTEIAERMKQIDEAAGVIGQVQDPAARTACDEVGPVELPEPVQEGEHNSLHYWFGVPQGMDVELFNQSVTGWRDGVDIKWGNQRPTSLRASRPRPIRGHLNCRKLTRAPQTLVEAFRIPEGCASAEAIKHDASKPGADATIEECRAMLEAISKDKAWILGDGRERVTEKPKYPQPLSRDAWRQVMFGIHQVRVHRHSHRPVDYWSSLHSDNYRGRADCVAQLRTAKAGRTTFATVAEFAKWCGADVSRLATDRNQKEREAG